MAVYLVDSTGATPGSYTSQGLATVAAVAAVDNAAEIRTVVAGTYGPLSIDNSAIANTRYTNTVGGNYTIALTLLTVGAWNPGAGTVFEGGTITQDASDSIQVYANNSIELRDFRLVLSSGSYAIRLSQVGAAVTLKRGIISGTCTIGAVVRIRPGAVATSLTVEDVGITADVECTIGAFWAWQGTPTVSIKNSGYARDVVGAALFYVSAGLTIPSLTLEGSHARRFVEQGGAFNVTSLSGGDNVYYGVVLAAAQATDVSLVDDRRLGGPDGLTPLHDSPLRRVIPSGDAIGTSTTDAYGQPRWRGGRQCVGPVQPQDQRMPLAVLAAV